MNPDPHHPQPVDDAAVPADHKLVDLRQYAEVMSNLADALGKLDVASFQSCITWTMQCTNECYPPAGSKPDPERSGDVVTSLSYFINLLLAQFPEPVETATELAEHIRTACVAEILEEPVLIQPTIDPAAIEELLNLFDEMDAIEASVLAELDDPESPESPSCTD